MSNLTRAWTNHKPVPDRCAKSFLKYMQENKAYMIPVGNFIFDSRSLSSKITTSICLRCTDYMPENCCCSNSYSIPDEQIKRLESVIPSILESMPDHGPIIESYNKYGAFTRGNTVTTRGNKNGHCLFSFVDEEGSHKCAIHAWCLENNLNPYDYKPYTCSSFPLEGIEMPNGKIVVFCTCKETYGFTMHHYTLNCRICLNEENMRKAVYGDLGSNKYMRSLNVDNIIKDDIIHTMKPVYQDQESIMRYLCGDDVYEEFIRKLG